ncbi:MSMEG_4193 family putative phosphomutase [Nocardioidaceae bacterium]|nr:MSMEG_4193 family putative phosphomutase [Nocardioidaceae bacterium]
MPTLVLARHGRSTANTGGVLAGRTPGVHLDDTGVEQARAAGSRLAGVPLAAAVSSPLERCRETAAEILGRQAYAGEHDAPPTPVLTGEPGLVECDYGDWSGRKITELTGEDTWKVVQAHPSAAVFPGGEAMADMAHRAVEAVRRHDSRVKEEHGDHAVWLAVSHGDVIKAILADALGLHLDSFQRIMVDTASLSVIRYTATRAFVVSSNTVAGDLTSLYAPPTEGETAAASSDAVVGGETGVRTDETPASPTSEES